MRTMDPNYFGAVNRGGKSRRIAADRAGSEYRFEYSLKIKDKRGESMKGWIVGKPGRHFRGFVNRFEGKSELVGTISFSTVCRS